jgi:spore maturation protein CgeB
MPHRLRIAYLAHSLRSDWNNGNAHFLRGLMRAMIALGHEVSIFEPCTEWSIQHLREEEHGERALRDFAQIYPELPICRYTAANALDPSFWRQALRDCEIVILHEWNSPQLAQLLCQIRPKLGYRLLFHDTHHRASSSPEQIRLFGIERFDGVLCFGNALRQIYRDRFGIRQAWTLHEAADTSVFRPRPGIQKNADVVWIGNWGDGERSREIQEFLLQPAAAQSERRFVVYGVRYPEEGIAALDQAGVRYGGYLPNLDAGAVYAAARLTVHIPRRQYSAAMPGIPTIRVFEALACGIPLISAPWSDTEELFREGDFLFVNNGNQMEQAMRKLLRDERAAREQALRGLETVLARHTCRHRAEDLTGICEDLIP